jgi:magnesium-transporting ATPase (P-type)
MDDWKKYIDSSGNFQLANFLYKSINELMKNSLDMGTLLSSDQHKLRAYKEQTKKIFKSKWLDIAQSLEFFDIIERCTCFSEQGEQYCEICKGARYRISSFLNSDEVREIGVFFNAAQNAELANKLQKGLMRALDELS